MKPIATGAGTAHRASPKTGAGHNITRPADKPRLPALWLPALAAVIFTGLTLLPRVSENSRLSASFWAAAGILVAGLASQWWSVARSGRALTYEFVPRRVHWVQMIMHSSVYAYWGWYWREVYHEIPLIAAQVLFLYALDMMVCWARRDNWILGFGPIPITFSMNLFLWFRDDWYYLQFVMVALIVFGKEFLRWKRDGQSTHIFNPSAFALFLTSIVLIGTNTTGMTWGNEIATTFLNPPNFFLEMFVLGLIVQSLFQVTLVTLSAAAALYVLNVIYTGATGTYMFIDTNIHPAIFLGLHLLVTDPATSPRKNFGKVIFGAAYGAGIFGLVPVLESLGAPVFYDKLLCVPILNLTVRALDRLSIAVSAWCARQSWSELGALQRLAAWSPRQLNLGFMGIWMAFFAVMFTTGFLAIGAEHPGTYPALWERACAAGSTRSCDVQARILDVQCQHNSAEGCFALGILLNDGKGLPRNPIGAARSLKQACDIGLERACTSLVGMVKTDGDGVLMGPCNQGDGRSCFMLGSVYYGGQGVTRNLERSATLFQQSCAAGFTRGCGQLGESYLFGEGVPKDFIKARQLLETACDGGYGEGCFNVGIMHRQGVAAPKNEIVALARFRQGCGFGSQKACEAAGPAKAATR
jgi:Sel1 repeat